MKAIHFLKSRKGEGRINTALKIVIGVVIGALLLAGLYALFAGENGIIGSVDREVNALMNFGGSENQIAVKHTQTEEGKVVLQYSYDGKRWLNANIPDYGEEAKVYGTLSGGDGENESFAALVQNGTTYYLIASADGVNWNERFSFTAKTITHFYYGTDEALPWTSGSFEGEKFVLRYWGGGSTYYTPVASNATTWSNGGWSDLIPIG